ncbi:hypothetical protein FRC04_004560 [Tulasnella sp. 424]|nr:hypothetical protein FRC04_004560 [Tulasnella sp. 424]
METSITPLTQGAAGFVPHIHQLPIELFQHLLSLAVAEIRHGDQPWRVYSRIVELRLVCTRWLAVIDSHPSFWTLLTNRLSTSLISIVLEKNGTLPLDVDLFCTTSGNDSPPLHYMNIVTSLAERWRSLNILWHYHDGGQQEALRNLLLTPASQLKAFSFDSGSGILMTINLFDNMTPNLDSFSTRQAIPNWNWLLMKGLRKLAVSSVYVDVRDLEALIRVLIATPNMEELELSGRGQTGGTFPGEPSSKLEPVVLDSLRLFTLRMFPSPWDYMLLEAIRIPQRCAVDIALNLKPSPQFPLSIPMKQLQTRLTGSSLLKVVFVADEDGSSAEYKYYGADGVGDTSISLRYPEGDYQLSRASQLWQSSLAEITESVQTSGIPVHISIFSNALPRIHSPDALTSTLKLVDELLPSVYKATFCGWYIRLFLSYASFPSFPNLSDLEVREVEATPWKEILECVEARSELATVQGWKFKPLRNTDSEIQPPPTVYNGTRRDAVDPMETPIALFTQGAAGFVPHIHQLPIELFQHLLSLAVAEIRHGDRPWRVYYSRIVELRLVCTRWLAVIDSHPSFWTLLTGRLGPSLVSLVLEKSGKLPLDVDLCTEILRTDPRLHYVDIVTSLAKRWRSLDILWHHRVQQEALRNLLLTPAPQLKAFSFDCRGGILNMISLFDNTTPDLDSFSTRRAVPNWNWVLTKGLRKLAVSEVYVDVRDLEALIQVLVASPNMEELEVSGWKQTGGTRPGEPSFKLEPVVLDSLRLFTLRMIPSRWAYKLLEAISIPQRCAVDIALNLNPSSQPPLSKPMEQLQTRLTGSSLLKVVFATNEDALKAEYKCYGTGGVGDTSIFLRYPELEYQFSEVPHLWLSSLAEITESVQSSGIPVHISIFSDSIIHKRSSDILTSTLKSVDELLPSLSKVSLGGRHIQQLLSHASSPSFPNLSDLVVFDVVETPWKEILECVSARSELAIVQGQKFKALRSISLPQGPIDQQAYERLSTLVENIYRN